MGRYLRIPCGTCVCESVKARLWFQNLWTSVLFIYFLCFFRADVAFLPLGGAVEHFNVSLMQTYSTVMTLLLHSIELYQSKMINM